MWPNIVITPKATVGEIVRQEHWETHLHFIIDAYSQDHTSF